MVDRGGAAISKEGINFTNAIYTKELNGSVSALRDIGRPNLSALQVLEEVEGDVIVEVTSTNFNTGEPGLTHIKKALRLGRNVVTTNKGSLAASLPSLVDFARRHRVGLRFSGAVGGALPVLDFAKNCLLPNEIESVRGVLNGTTNHILWNMAEKQIRLPEAISEAQKLGYAEENILYDLKGLDTACKLVILSYCIMNRKVRLEDVEIHGISNITLEEVLDARRKGYSIRLIGSINKKTKVSPERISSTDPLCVSSALNAVSLNCTYSGQHLLIGMGAGGKETASSILRDIVNIDRENNLSNQKKDSVLSVPSENVKNMTFCGGIS
jgi:homoserine dehydrogenase